MATFLELCQRVHRYARMDKHAPGTAPVTVIGQGGVLAEIVAWVDDASMDIQNDQDDWLFRMKSGTVQVSKRDTDIGAGIDDFDVLRPYVANESGQYILCGPTDGAQNVVRYIPWNLWRGGIHDRNASASGSPGYYTVLPTGEIRVDPVPASAVTLQFDYRAQAKALVVDADIPLIPARNAAVIVWRALMYYADTRDGTAESYKKWERRYGNEMRRLYQEQLPEVTL